MTGDGAISPEDQLLAAAGPLDVTLYTRPGCHLCEEAKTQIAPLLKTAGARLREVNIDTDPVLRARHDFDVPVIFLGTRRVAKHRVDLRQFRRQLDEAGAAAQTSG
jgi:glutaredoxin